MKIAVTHENGTVFQHFGHTESFKVYEVIAVTFYYGQRHKLEIECAKEIANELGVEHHILDMALLNQLAPNALTRDDGAQLQALTLGLFLSQVLLFILLAVIAMIALRCRQTSIAAKIDLSPRALSKEFDSSPIPRLLKLALIIYTAQALINQIINSVMDLVKLGIPNTFGSLTDLIVPYFFLAIYSILGYLALDYTCRWIARNADR